MASQAANEVIAGYSTSFGLATRLLGRRVRQHVRNIYALVRVADEIVDTTGTELGLSSHQQRVSLDELEAECSQTIASGFSSNLIVHAFAITARECGITTAHYGPFFASMRTDLSVEQHDLASHREYVYGSAEVVGLMCLQVFVNAGRDQIVEPAADLVAGAQALGAAFQDINFLRDATDDREVLGRDYLGLASGDARALVLDRIDGDLRTARRAIGQLPRDCRGGVAAAYALFQELAARLRNQPTDDQRVRVPDPVKLWITARAVVFGPARGTP